MAALRLILLSFFLLLAGTALTHAQDATLGPAVGDGRIDLDVVVTDAKGRPVSGLDRPDFSLIDNNLPQKIVSFEAFDGAALKADPPVEVILLIDTVNLSADDVSIVRDQLKKFLRQNDGHLSQPVSLFMLNNEGLHAQSKPSTDGNALALALDHLDVKLRTLGEGTAAWGAVERFEVSLQHLAAIAEKERLKPGRKLLIWCGPGWPQLATPAIELTAKGLQQNFNTITHLSTALRLARIALYSVSLGQARMGALVYQDSIKPVRQVQHAYPANLGLKVLAVQTGGRVLGPDNDLAAQIKNCFADAGAFYTLSFTPARADRANEFHDLKIVIDKPGLAARTRNGYYGQP